MSSLDRDLKKKKEIDLKPFEQIKHEGNKYWYIAKGIDLLSMGFGKAGAFLLPAAQGFLLSGKGLLAGISSAAYLSQEFILNTLDYYKFHMIAKYGKHNLLDIEEKTNDIYNMTRGKVNHTEKTEDGKEIEKKMTNAEVRRTCAEHLRLARRLRDVKISSMTDFASTGLMTVSALTIGAQNTNNLPLFFGCAGVSLGISGMIAYDQYKRLRNLYKDSWKIYNDIEKERQDLLNVRPFNKKHMEFMVNNYIESNRDVLEKQFKNDMKNNNNRFKMSFTTYAAVTALVFGSMSDKIVGMFAGKAAMDMTNFTSLIALSTMFRGVINYMGSLVRNVQDAFDINGQYKISKEKFKEIVDVYYKEQEKQFKSDITVGEIEIKDYYFEFSSKDDKEEKHFIKADNISMKKGQNILISGESGSGKSTFVKSIFGYTKDEVAEGSIRINEIELNRIPNAVMYDPEDKMGSKTLFEEITFNDLKDKLEENEKRKLENIIEGLCLKDCIMRNDTYSSVTEAVKNKYADTFSEGERRRLLLARLLYNMDEKTDVVCLDEPTANLDKSTAREVMKYVKNYCNAEKERIMITISHDTETIIDNDLADKWYEIDESNRLVEV